MPLVVSKLTDAIKDVLKNKNGQPPEIAKKLAQAYTTYALDGTAGPTLPQITPASTAALELQLLNALSSPAAGLAMTFSLAIGNGLTAYWMAPPVPFVGPGAFGVTTAIIGAPALPALLTPIMGVPFNTLDSASMAIASAMDVATKTVLVLVTITPSPPVPLPFT